jgi:IS5 family transposase
MADPRVFVSFDFDHDEASRNLFCGQGKSDSPTPFTVSDWSSREALAQSKWKEIIRDRINRTNMVIVLAGRYMGTATGVVAEIAMAKECDVPVFGVYVDGAGPSATLPTGLHRNRTVQWTWQNVANGIDQCMREGKNAR